MRLIALAFICFALLCSPVAASAQDASPYRKLQALDGQLATIGYRLATANAPLCDRLDGATGLQLHDIAQYRDRAAIDGVFAFESPVEVEAVVPGSPGQAAGIAPGDALATIGVGAAATPIAAFADGLEEDPYSRIQRIADLFATARAAGASIRLELLRAGQPLSFTLAPVPACAGRFQLLIKDGLDAGGGGSAQMVNVNLPLVQYALEDGGGNGEGELAAVVAHELAHNILHHHERLNAVDIDRGPLRGFGKNGRRIRATEEEADRLSVWLLANAGYDPAGAVRFWTRFGKEHGQGLFTEGTHYRWQKRVAQIEEEIAALPSAETRGIARVPPILTHPLPPLE
ncbi:peptidase M48, Ste24p [Novosphingopyxis sp.]|uniref:peptidase M48, Ste24p n=1 Tax=Novosphingopyxis sp. TaxID=2709690 RepID=UPI003B5BEEDC